MKSRRLSGGRFAYYWIPHERDVTAGFTLAAEKLGFDFAAAAERATALNVHLDAWRGDRGIPKDVLHEHRVGTIDWWHDQFMRHTAYTKNSARTRKDYSEVLALVADLETALTDAVSGRPVRIGTLPAASLSPQAVDKIYQRLRDGGRVNRQADYAMDVCRRAWKVVSRLNPGLFLVPVTGPDGKMQRLAINPFEKMIRETYARDTAKPATIEEAMALAEALEAIGHPALAVAPLICYEWLQRPADVVSGALTWTDYKPAHRPGEVRVIHAKTGKHAWQPLTAEFETPGTGPTETLRLTPELEDRLDNLDRIGVPVVMFRPERGPKDASGQRIPRLYSESYAQHLVQRARRLANLPNHVTLEACRHGGMTELGDFELTEQEIMSLSTHVTPAAARLYVKRTETQRRNAAIKRRRGRENGTKAG